MQANTSSIAIQDMHALLQNFFLNQYKPSLYSIHWTHAITVSSHSASKPGNFQCILTIKISWPRKFDSTACHQRINSYLLSLLYVQNFTGGRNSLFHTNISVRKANHHHGKGGFLTGLRSIPLTRVHSCSLARA